jgi:hypothetical protein
MRHSSCSADIIQRDAERQCARAFICHEGAQQLHQAG